MSRTQMLPGSKVNRRESAPFPSLSCSRTDISPDTAWVHFAGALDFATVSQLAQTLRQLETGARMVVLDLRDLDVIDFFGVHAIANASTRARHVGRRLVLLRGAHDIDRMFALAGRLSEVEFDDLESREPGVHAPSALAP